MNCYIGFPGTVVGLSWGCHALPWLHGTDMGLSWLHAGAMGPSRSVRGAFTGRGFMGLSWDCPVLPWGRYGTLTVMGL